MSFKYIRGVQTYQFQHDVYDRFNQTLVLSNVSNNKVYFYNFDHDYFVQLIQTNILLPELKHLSDKLKRGFGSFIILAKDIYKDKYILATKDTKLRKQFDTNNLSDQELILSLLQNLRNKNKIQARICSELMDYINNKQYRENEQLKIENKFLREQYEESTQQLRNYQNQIQQEAVEKMMKQNDCCKNTAIGLSILIILIYSSAACLYFNLI